MCGEFSHTSDGLTLFYKQDRLVAVSLAVKD